MALPLAFGQLISAKRKGRDLRNLLNKAPKYKIQDEAYDNQAIARGEAYGKDRAIQMQEQGLEQDTSNAIGAVKDVTSSTSGLLATIAAINANKDSTTRDLAMGEAQLQSQKKSQLLGVNNQMIDEKDKAWNYNTNMPYQMKVAALRDKIKFNQEQAAQQFAASSNFMTNMFAGGGFNYQQPNSQQTQVQGGGAANQSATGFGSSSTMNYRPSSGGGMGFA